MYLWNHLISISLTLCYKKNGLRLQTELCLSIYNTNLQSAGIEYLLCINVILHPILLIDYNEIHPKCTSGKHVKHPRQVKAPKYNNFKSYLCS